jgi:hypothetical protein
LRNSRDRGVFKLEINFSESRRNAHLSFARPNGDDKTGWVLPQDCHSRLQGLISKPEEDSWEQAKRKTRNESEIWSIGCPENYVQGKSRS